MKAVPNAKIGFAKAIAAKWIELDKAAAGGARVVRKVAEINDEVGQLCAETRRDPTSVDRLPEAMRTELKKRKLLVERCGISKKSHSFFSKMTVLLVRRGAKFAVRLPDYATDLTAELLASGDWRTQQFKSYNFDALGAPVTRGHLHPLLKVRSEFRQIFLEMGWVQLNVVNYYCSFSEMPTNNYVESSFWNFDALFQPQQHPARDAHDTFFIARPAEARLPDADYVERVGRMHTSGGDSRSLGYQYDWAVGEARKNLLRTHTTAVSARMLYRLAQQVGWKLPTQM